MSKKVTCFALGALLLAMVFPVEAQETKKVSRIGFLDIDCQSRSA